MENFTELPESRVFISTDAGSTGLNLQVASILINIDLPWNPAVLEQRIARIHRIGQQRTIQVINLVAPSSIEERMLSTLNFKTSLFEGILDNGEDSIFLEDSKLDKIMEHIATTVVTPADKEQEGGEVIRTGEKEEENPIGKENKQNQQPETDDTEREPDETATDETFIADDDDIADSPSQLIQQGISFFSSLAKTLQSPESTRELVDSLIEEDKETGQTSLRIPVPDKESVTTLLRLIGKMITEGNK